MSAKTVIDSKSNVISFLKEFWEYRNLVLVFAWRDLRVRYAQTTIGLLWAFVQPLFTILALWLVFGRFVKVDTGNVPALAFVASGVAIWSYFSFVALQSAQSIIQAQQMIKKIYFPKIVLPISKSFLGLVDLAVVAIILVIILFSSGITLPSQWWIAPLVVFSLLAFSLGLGIWISALSIRYRDLQHVFPFLIQLGIYITPVAYPSSFVREILPSWATSLYYLNPVAGLIDLFRFAIFNTPMDNNYWQFSMVSGLLVLLSGLYFFRITERKIADLV